MGESMNKALPVSHTIDASGMLLTCECEADPNFKFIPLIVRMKLDLAGVRISLDDWQTLSLEQRMGLISSASDNDVGLFKYALMSMLKKIGSVTDYTVSEVPTGSAEWLESAEPETVEKFRKLAQFEVDWHALSYFGRFILCYAVKKDSAEFCQQAMQELCDLNQVQRSDINRSKPELNSTFGFDIHN
jgi:hypothetical protein